MKKIFNLILISSLIFCACAGEKSIYMPMINPSKGEFFPIVAWTGPPAEYITDKAYKDLADCNFTINLSFYKTYENNNKALLLSKKYNLKQIVYDQRIDLNKSLTNQTYKELDKIMEDYGSFSSLFGYHIIDEPEYLYFEKAGSILHYFESKDPLHYGYINLYPNYASREQLGTTNYTEYIDSYLQIVDPSILSFDHYPILTFGLRENFFKNLEIIREHALKYNKSFWGFARSLPYANYPVPTEGHLRFQIYSNLIYGAKGIQYFKYWPKERSIWNFPYAIVTPEGEKSIVYYIVQKINAEILYMGQLFLDLKSTSVFHSEPVPIGCTKIPDKFVFSVESAKPVCIGTFEDSNSEQYFMILNRDYEHFSKVNIKFNQKIKKIYEIAKSKKYQNYILYDKNNIQNIEFELLPGDGRLFRFSK